ncbi:MAG TPA: hypothetical protein VIV14_02440 [Gammaproteobacteria bacterium]
MVLAQLQELLQEVYALETAYDVNDFLTTDAGIAESLDRGGRRVEEKLLIAEDDAEASVSLYLQQDLLDRLLGNNPAERIADDNLSDLWIALEGVSHFLYYAWNASADKAVTLMEMEMQAEVDKFIATTVLLQRQGSSISPNLHHWLFELTRFDALLSEEELTRYQDANFYASKYCRKLAPQLGRWKARGAVNRELCDFYRYSQPAKIRHIEAA